MRENPDFNQSTSDFAWLLGQFTEIINVLVFVIFALALVVIIWQIISVWIISGGDAAKVKDGKTTIMIAFIALVVMSAVWGIVALLRSSII